MNVGLANGHQVCMFDQKCASYSGDIVSRGFAGSAGSFLSSILRSCSFGGKIFKSGQNPLFELPECQPHAYPHICISVLANRHCVECLNVNPMPINTCAYAGQG